jgi:hypothetical protein
MVMIGVSFFGVKVEGEKSRGAVVASYLSRILCSAQTASDLAFWGFLFVISQFGNGCLIFIADWQSSTGVSTAVSVQADGEHS